MLRHLQGQDPTQLVFRNCVRKSARTIRKGASMRTFLFGLAVTLALAVGMPSAQAQDNNAREQDREPKREQDGVPKLDHVFVIVLENHNSFTSCGSTGVLDKPQP